MKARRPAVLAISIGLVLAAVLAVLGLLHGIAPDRESLRAGLSREIDRLDQLPASDPVRRDRRIEELLAVEDYQTHARALWLRLERMHGPAHQAARADDAARKAVLPFLARCGSLDGLSLADLRVLDDEARSLLDSHGATRYGPGLVQVRERVAQRMAVAVPSCVDLDHFRILQEAEKERLEGRYAGALARIEEARLKHPKCGPFLVRLGEKREDVLRSGSQAAQKLLSQARENRSEGARLLERAVPNFKGLPDAGRLQALVADLRRP